MGSQITLATFLTGVALILSGCEFDVLSRISSLENKVEQQRQLIAELEKKTNELQTELFLKELDGEENKSASFDPAADEGFARLDTSLGTLVVSIENVSPHADGVKVRLNVGNLTTATIVGGVINAKWGARRQIVEGEFWAGYNEWYESLTERQISFTEELKPGHWNRVTIMLPGIEAAKFGYLDLAFDASQLKLLKQN